MIAKQSLNPEAFASEILGNVVILGGKKWPYSTTKVDPFNSNETTIIMVHVHVIVL